MYLPRSLISHLYQQLLRSHNPLSPPVLILVALEPDALCACRILTALLKRDYIPHKIQPIAGYGDLSQAGAELVHPMHTSNGGSGGVVVCLGVGGLVDMYETLGLDVNKDEPGNMGGIEVWVIDARRPWNLTNVFGGMGEPATPRGSDTHAIASVDGVDRGRLTDRYRPGKGGIIAFDDGDIDEELAAEREAYYTLETLPEVGEEDSDDDDDATSDEEVQAQGKKRKSWSGRYDGDIAASEDEDGRPAQRRRSNSGSSIASPLRLRERRHDSSQSSRSGSPVSDSPSLILPKEPSTRTLRKRLIRLKRKHESVLQAYYSLGTSYSEPISSLLYSLASELGRDDNDLLWLAIVGVSSLELSGRTMSGVGISDSSESGGSAGWGGQRGERIRQILRDEVRRLNPPDDNEAGREALRSELNGVIPTNARSPTDTSILLSPEPRLLLLRHWSLYDSMLHSPYLAPRLHVWNETGRKRLRKLLAKMGVSLTQCQQNYTHMDMDLKRDLRQKMLQYAPMYGMEGLVPPASSGGHSGSREGWGFARCWGWKACLSATDIGVILGSILEVGSLGPSTTVSQNFPSHSSEVLAGATQAAKLGTDSANVLSRFWSAYDALAPTSDSPTQLLAAIPLAQHLHRAILRTGTALLSKHQIRHLRAFRIAVVKEGPDVKLFTNPGALTKLALWIGEAVRIQEKEKGTGMKIGKRRAAGTPLVLAGLDEDRNVYVVVGTGGGGGVIDFAAMAKRREEQRKKKETREKKKAEREERRAKRREEMQDDDDELAEEEESSESDTESDSESEPDLDSFSSKNLVRNRFGIAFQEVVHETNARVRIDSFEHCVVEVQKEDLGAFLEALSFRSVVG
ncbi:uncharacterized protein ARB_00042 [Trichophyton benhamiae CBS 112371]|uniref:DNA replication initiation factor Cdc45 n=1 Tax=Arthroderma benhamiae (strain ATCC MYA-4681 / CBS 112371) TaxID=663331 RepID=D4AV33_ARTBC|nr:uncharacterized protein ARB_00042 [Trichophyton benhamiae CBS 112371]EFE32955.1 hypothetical protein ARB_00042 [Trichophyton benhamiae CBS 112371]